MLHVHVMNALDKLLLDIMLFMLLYEFDGNVYIQQH
jgi:hypothetical protein